MTEKQFDSARRVIILVATVAILVIGIQIAKRRFLPSPDPPCRHKRLPDTLWAECTHPSHVIRHLGKKAFCICPGGLGK